VVVMMVHAPCELELNHTTCNAVGLLSHSSRTDSTGRRQRLSMHTLHNIACSAGGGPSPPCPTAHSTYRCCALACVLSAPLAAVWPPQCGHHGATHAGNVAACSGREVRLWTVACGTCVFGMGAAWGEGILAGCQARGTQGSII
jgi:hypothetical protein